MVFVEQGVYIDQVKEDWNYDTYLDRNGHLSEELFNQIHNDIVSSSKPIKHAFISQTFQFFRQIEGISGRTYSDEEVTRVYAFLRNQEHLPELTKGYGAPSDEEVFAEALLALYEQSAYEAYTYNYPNIFPRK